MVMMRKAAALLHCQFHLVMNDTDLS